MKKLLLTSILGLSFIIPNASFAGVNVFGVDTHVNKSEISSNILSSTYTAQDHSLENTLVPQKLRNPSFSNNFDTDKDSYYVFGVNIASNNLI